MNGYTHTMSAILNVNIHLLDSFNKNKVAYTSMSPYFCVCVPFYLLRSIILFSISLLALSFCSILFVVILCISLNPLYITLYPLTLSLRQFHSHCLFLYSSSVPV